MTEIMLSTKERMKRMNSKTYDKCVQCRVAMESSLHAIIEYPRNKGIANWLGNQFGEMGVVGNITLLSLIRLDLPPNRLLPLSFWFGNTRVFYFRKMFEIDGGLCGLRFISLKIDIN